MSIWDICRVIKANDPENGKWAVVFADAQDYWIRGCEHESVAVDLCEDINRAAMANANEYAEASEARVKELEEGLHELEIYLAAREAGNASLVAHYAMEIMTRRNLLGRSGQ
jgi:hypothetical protein